MKLHLANVKMMNDLDDTILQYSRIQKLEKPTDVNMKFLQEWLVRPEGGDFFFQGREAEIWQDGKDLIAFTDRQANSDSLTRWISGPLVPWYHQQWGHRVKVSSPLSLNVVQSVHQFHSRARPQTKTGMAFSPMRKAL